MGVPSPRMGWANAIYRNRQQFGFGLTGLALSKPNGLAKPIKLEPAWQLILAQIGSVQLELSQTELNPVKAAQA